MIEVLLERVTKRKRATSYASGRRRALGFLSQYLRRKSYGRMRKGARKTRSILARSSYRARTWRKW